MVSLHAEVISKKYNVSNVAALRNNVGAIYLLVFFFMCLAMKFAIPKGFLLVWSSLVMLPVSPVGRTCINYSDSL